MIQIKTTAPYDYDLDSTRPIGQDFIYIGRTTYPCRVVEVSARILREQIARYEQAAFKVVIID